MIQRYIHSDYSRIIEIWDSSMAVSSGYLSEENKETIGTGLATYLKKTEVFVYRKSGIITAFMVTDNNKLEMLFCHPDYIGYGIGSFMLDYAIKFLNIKYVDVSKHNINALNFYKSHGFQEVAYLNHEEFGYPIIHLMLEKGK